MSESIPNPEDIASLSIRRPEDTSQPTFASQQSVRCPICSKRFDPSNEGVAMPFCSTRCKQIDLGRWLGEAYGIPYAKPEDDDEA